MKNLISIAVVLALVSGLILGSIGTVISVHAQTTGGGSAGGGSAGGGQNATSGGGSNATSGNNTGNPLSKVPIIGGLLGGGK
jgi:hypothetical protein